MAARKSWCERTHRLASRHSHAADGYSGEISDRRIRSLLLAEWHRRTRLLVEAFRCNLPLRTGARMSAIKARIVVLGGDGIGPEVAREGVRVLEAIAQRFGHTFEFEQHLIGGAAIDATQS